ncbi:dihydroxyacetone kinase phosphoryl donor subunit DhaM [Alicyclobacillus acidoterrestris]|uniref:phosphoenolpyruvate--glycerone phosphotransferase n=1 Tax=Alicyclobacillus acidoterrestris (strain ATCC 49025 / DSM 3922 / CIP 106132 / NCIMB 13137 / GD3B) TaxID=1356854 RepID=T0BQB2_ALIAG|nr:dihydroxyacetone kinase phosphoryl donor subunit DhaM [Alicyclobacillus acidoterrestris]EPZ42944.1 hypothetical protein N007_14160 [Alicyclobacillus acidoterrestris ATCC 49025]UNO50039.1 PTS-dependent dihydroxyacetone kinase phosphotransferase subunit DhaM [Alicyclobacillus acidoterrestris]GEO25249.1 PTS-dependent dihydroxyacetone kinase phosphotransferase subunit DhaM [Alicyclobacillus acidoterrestris]
MANISLLIVSHSRDLGAGLVTLLGQLAGPEVDLRHAAGLGDNIGTDATFIMKQLTHCPRDNEILIFFDLGSALMNTQMALELIDEDVQSRTHIVDAPLVEGAIAAAVSARAGMPVEQIMQHAREAKWMEKITREA